MRPSSSAFRTAMLNCIEGRSEKALFLSGGTDSATILAALLALGRKPDCYSFRLGERDSVDTAVAKSMCKAFGLSLKVMDIPRNEQDLIKDIKTVISVTRRTTKTHVQCSQPFIYLCRMAVADGHSRALFGMAADDLYGTSRHGNTAFQRHGDNGFRQYREEKFSDMYDSMASVVRLSKHFGIELFDPYMTEGVSSHLLSCTYAQLHRPVSKAIAFEAFPEFWRHGNWRRDNAPLQVVSGVREWHDTLLSSSVWNKRGSKSVVGIYNDIASDLGMSTIDRERHELEIER